MKGRGEIPEFLESSPPLIHALEAVSRRTRVPAPFVVAVPCVALYAIGYAIAGGLGEESTYRTYFVIPLGIVGFGFVLSAVMWAHRRYAPLVWDLRHGYAHGYVHRLRVHWKRLTDPGRALLLEVPLVAGAVGYVVLVRFVQAPWDAIPKFSDWIAFGPLPLFVYLAILAGLAGYVSAVGAYLFLEHIWFLSTLADLQTNDRALLTRKVDLDELAMFSFYGSGTWFVGLGLVTLIFYHDVTAYTIGAYLTATALGLVFFIMPQAYIHRDICRSKKDLLNRLRKQLPEEWEISDNPEFSQQAVGLLNLIHQVDRLSEWPIEVNVIFLELIAASSPIFLALASSQLGIPI